MAKEAGYNGAMTDNTLGRIETLLSHQEKQIHDLSDMVIAQGKEIEALKLRIERLNAKIANVETTATDGGEKLSATEQAARDKPPHY